MAVLTYKQRKEVERHIRNYRAYKDDVAEWRELAARGRKRDAGPRKEPRRTSDPTAAAALRLASPPKSVRDKALWAEAVERVRAKCEGTGKGRLFELWFWRTPQDSAQAAEELFVSRKQLYNWLGEIIVHVALVAAQKGVFDFDE